MWITRPSRRSRIEGSTARVQYSAPFRLTPMTRSHSPASRSLKKRWGTLVPAQLRRMSIRPWRSRIAAAARSTACLSAVSTASASLLPPACLISAAVSASASARLPDTTTVAPPLASSTADACPMPLPPPVTQAILPDNEPTAQAARSIVLDGDHHRPGKLVVPALLALVEGDREETQEQWNDRSEVSEVSLYEFAGGGRAEGAGIHNSRRDEHLSRRRAAVAPEQDRGDGRQDNLEQDVGPEGLALLRELEVVPSKHRKKDEADDHGQDQGVDEESEQAHPEAHVFRLARCHRFGHGHPLRAHGSPTFVTEATSPYYGPEIRKGRA